MQIGADVLRRNPNRHPDPWPFEPIINRVRPSVDDYCSAEFQVILIRGFRFIMQTYSHTHIDAPRDKVIALSSSSSIDHFNVTGPSQQPNSCQKLRANALNVCI